MRYVLVDFRGEWADKYQKTATWISGQLKDDKTEQELLEAAKSFVSKRFEVDKETLKEDESFRDSLTFRRETIPQDVLKNIEKAELDKNADESILTDQVIGLIKIRIKGARSLPKSSSWFTSSKPDPYVRLIDNHGQEIVRTRTISETTDPSWDEIHYVSIHGVGQKVTFEIYDENLFVSDKLLGVYVLDTGKLVVKNKDGTYATSDPVTEWFPLHIEKKSKGELSMEIQFISTSFNVEEGFVFKRETIKDNHLYTLLSWRTAKGYFEYSNDLARFFNYSSQGELKTGLIKHTSTEIQNLSESAISTALVITYLKIICWKYRNDWKKIISNSEEWLSSEIENIELEDKLYEACEKFIIERFQIKEFEEEQKTILVSGKTFS